jgi:hypothetical protein
MMVANITREVVSVTSWNGDGKGESGDEADGEPLIAIFGEVD